MTCSSDGCEVFYVDPSRQEMGKREKGRARGGYEQTRTGTDDGSVGLGEVQTTVPLREGKSGEKRRKNRKRCKRRWKGAITQGRKWNGESKIGVNA